ncbi:MAG: diguanylate cyclase [Tenericutes bacterium]|nr:diguanylate cyclase [Mycoplasmatota bacterium]
MKTSNYFNIKIVRNALIISSTLILSLYFYLSIVNDLLYHTIVSYSIITLGVIGPVVGILTAFRIKKNIMSKLSPFLFIYIILLFIHMLSYRGMNLFQNINPSFSSQIWLGANTILALGCLITTIDYKGKLNVVYHLVASTLLACVFFSLAYYKVLPRTIDANEITTFARGFQAFIIIVYVTTLILWLSNKKLRTDKDYKNVFISYILLLISELLLFNHFIEDDFFVFAGLTARFVSFIILMYTIFVVNLIRPYNDLYQEIIDDNLLQRSLKEKNIDFIRRLSRSQEIAHVGTWELDLKTQKIWVSNEAARIYGLQITDDHMVDFETVKKVALQKERNRLDLAMKNLLERNIKYDITFTILNSLGEYHHIHSVAYVSRDGDVPLVVHGVINDITELKNEKDKLLYASYHDHLTNVYNRRYFLEQRIALNFEKYLPVSTFILDINGLKIINDSFGHHVGNQVLRKLTSIISQFVTKENSFVARIGGDEFAIILANTNEDEANDLMTSILKQIKREKVGNINLSVAYGLAVKEKLEETFDEVLKKAEDDMYLHKISDSLSVRNGIIDALLKTLYEKDIMSEEHSRRVSDLAWRLAKAANLSEKKASDIKVAGILHDIGKITIANQILEKKGKLTDEEYRIIKTHAEKGYKIIHSIGGMDTIANYILQHHERYDGFGYPKNIKGEDISYEGRIICIADSYDAMTSLRTYKERMTGEAAINELIGCKGKQFDPELVDIS